MSGFETRIDKVVGEFLETALVVDDEALRQMRPKPSPIYKAKESGERPRARGDFILEDPAEGAVEVVEEHPLKSKELIDAFADDGILCSVIAPRKDDEIHARVLKAASRADLLVLDWELHRDGGKTARELIKGILEQDTGADRRRLRVIAVYTGQPDLLRIMRRIVTDLDLSGDAVQDGGLTLTKDGFRIIGLCKPIQEILPPHIAARQIEEADLPRRLAGEFARLTDGLVPAVALAALAAIRNDAHRILQALDRELDIAYLGHRVASPFPKEAEAHLVAMLASEIASILDDKDVGAKADMPAIQDWLKRARAREADPLVCGSALTERRELTDKQIESMLTDGLGLDEQLEEQKAEGLNVKALKKVRRQAAHLFTNTPADADKAADAFGMRMAVRTLYTRPHRVLRLGTIVWRGGAFLLCVQPRCDSVRLKVDETRGYPFLPLTVTEAEGAKHEFVVQHPEEGRLVRLHLHAKPLNLKVIPFVASEHRCVEAKEKHGTWAFYNSQTHPYRWVADLKPEFAQRVAVDLGGQLARVGLSESELVRQSGAR